MAKNKPTRANQKTKKKPAQTHPQQPTRRDFIGLARKGAIGVGLLSFTGFFAYRSVQGALHERDLTRLGNGQPTIVQVHDPSCSMCAELQKETRAALKEVGEGRLQYLIADIKTEDGQIFAGQYGVPHVTLMLFDGNGQHHATYNGIRNRTELIPIFRAHIGQFGAAS